MKYIQYVTELEKPLGTTVSSNRVDMTTNLAYFQLL